LKINRHRDEITRALNPVELMPQLSKEMILDFNETSVLLADSKSTCEKSRYILQCLEVKDPSQSVYSKFLSCIKAERNHMGHAYIASLLEEEPAGSKSELEESLRLKEAIQRHYPEMMDISPEALAPLMYSKKLLTSEEEEKLQNTDRKTRTERVHLLLHLLNTKGPLAHGLFVECLKSEASHPTHKELYTVLMTSSCHPKQREDSYKQKQKCAMDEGALAAVLPRRIFFRRWEVKGSLKGEKYDEMVRVFHNCHHNGKWKELEIKIAELEKACIPEFKAVANFQKATIRILRKEPETAMQFMDEAKRIIETEVHGENRSALLGRCECMLSRHFQYLKDYEKAREHVVKAKKHLCGIEPCEDSAFVHYCEASLTVECLNELSTTDDIDRAEDLFVRAITDDRSNENGLGLFMLHSLLHLTQMYLGSTHYTPGTVKDIKRAKDFFKIITSKYNSLPERTKCLYYLIESDLHRNCGRIDKAKESLQIVLSISKDHNFELEISSARTRMQSLAGSQPCDPTHA
jgi:tetratricopeptide (TPR) repeat protein